ncbi:MAG TPA: hypothetical protein VGF94_06520 [Kofleriaceae bacterium]|jgi:hypothetical protein
MTRALATSPDGQWAALRDGRELVLFAAGAPPEVARTELASDDVDLALVGPPAALVAIEREAGRARVVLYEPPSLEAAARIELDQPVQLAAITGPRLVLVAPGAQKLAIVRAAPRGLALQTVDVGSPIELAVGLEKNQVLLGLLKKLEVWDAATGRPMLRPNFPLPPPPRELGTAAGHLWAIQPGHEDVFVYRLSDGRPFRHYVGAPIEGVVCHRASPVLVLVTKRGLVRLHCYAHSLSLVDDAPWQPGMPLALLVNGEDVALIGLADGAREPWRVTLAGATIEPSAPHGKPPEAPRVAIAAGWRDALAMYGEALVRGADGEVPAGGDGELADLAQRLALPPSARRALIALYAAYLVGEPALPIARLARAAGDWNEPLGRGELAALALLHREGGRVALRAPVTDVLDGAPPRAVRVIGDGPATVRAGAFRVGRDGRGDAEIEAALAAQLGRIALAHGPLADALLEARLRGAPCVAFATPDARPSPWPRDAALVLVLYGSTSSWVADLPAVP